MVQIGCRCPMHLQDIFLEHVRGFKAQEMPADWLEQLMAVGAEGLAGASSGSSHKGKGKGKMPAAADDGRGRGRGVGAGAGAVRASA